VWIATVVAVALALSYFVARRGRAATPVAVAPVAALPPGPALPAALAEPAPPAVAGDAPGAAAAEGPLPTWVRATIVAAALVAFFAVSLIATKRV
jgi:hypothetical protein